MIFSEVPSGSIRTVVDISSSAIIAGIYPTFTIIGRTPKSPTPITCEYRSGRAYGQMGEAAKLRSIINEFVPYFFAWITPIYGSITL